MKMHILKVLGEVLDYDYLTNIKDNYAYYEIGDEKFAYDLNKKFNATGGRCDVLISLTDFEVDGFRFYGGYDDEQIVWLCDTGEEIVIPEADKGIYRIICQELGCRAISQSQS